MCACLPLAAPCPSRPEGGRGEGKLLSARAARELSDCNPVGTEGGQAGAGDARTRAVTAALVLMMGWAWAHLSRSEPSTNSAPRSPGAAMMDLCAGDAPRNPLAGCRFRENFAKDRTLSRRPKNTAAPCSAARSCCHPLGNGHRARRGAASDGVPTGLPTLWPAEGSPRGPRRAPRLPEMREGAPGRPRPRGRAESDDSRSVLAAGRPGPRGWGQASARKRLHIVPHPQRRRTKQSFLRPESGNR